MKLFNKIAIASALALSSFATFAGSSLVSMAPKYNTVEVQIPITHISSNAISVKYTRDIDEDLRVYVMSTEVPKLLKASNAVTAGFEYDLDVNVRGDLCLKGSIGLKEGTIEHPEFSLNYTIKF